jgi:hypothetical protein
VTEKEKILSKELIVASEIYRLTEIEKQTAYFSKLSKVLSEKRKVSPATLNKSLDILFDLGMIYADWEKLENGRWARVLKIAGESKAFIKGIYEEIYGIGK